MTLPGLLVLQPVALLLVGVLVLHERGRRASGSCATDGRDAAAARRQAWLFRLGIVLGTAVVSSPLEHYGANDLFARTLVALALGWVVAPLIVLGAPWDALRAGTGRRRVSAVGPPSPKHPAGRGLWPFYGVGAYFATLAIFHVPAVLDATASSLALRSVQLVLVLSSAVLVWSQLVGSHPHRPVLQPLGRVTLVVAILAGTWALAAPMAYSGTNWYPAFAAGGTAMLGTTLRQQLAGGALWGIPAIPLSLVAFWCFAEWLRRDGDSEWQLQSLLQRTPPESKTAAGATWWSTSTWVVRAQETSPARTPNLKEQP